MNTEDRKAPPPDFSQLRPGENHLRTLYVVAHDQADQLELSVLFENADYKVRSFVSAESLLAMVNQNTAGVLIMDHSPEDMSGLALLAELKKRGVGLKTIFISECGNIKAAVQAIRNGAIDFIEKPYTSQQLLNSVEEALSQANTEVESRQARNTVDNRYEQLTRRELEVLKFLVRGDSSRKLAERFGLSSRTVDIHRTKIMRKLQAATIPDLVRIAYTSNDVLPEEVLIDIRQSPHFLDDKEAG